jgi:hypothetical protein
VKKETEEEKKEMRQKIGARKKIITLDEKEQNVK